MEHINKLLNMFKLNLILDNVRLMAMLTVGNTALLVLMLLKMV